MRLRTLTAENFGPYYGTQRIEFSRDRGVWIVYGRNGRGKTTLLNAFRYALYGKIMGRKAEREPRELANRAHHSQNSVAEFKTVLEFEHDGREYKLTRRFSDVDDPKHVTVLEREGTPLPDSHAVRELSRIAPESLSQFFLFDGELLRQYEDLRDADVDSGRRMREEVDRLLGVRALENAISDLAELHRGVTREKAKQLQGEKKATNLATALHEASDIRDRLFESKRSLSDELAAKERRLREVEEALGRHEAAQHILGQLDEARAQLTSLEISQNGAREALKELAEDVWRVALEPRLRERLGEISRDLDMAKERRAEAIVHRRTRLHLESNDSCPVCERPMDTPTRESVLQRADSQADADQIDRVVAGLQRRLEVLQGVRDATQTQLLAERERTLRQIDLRVEEQREDIEELENRLQGIDETEVRKRQRERDQLKELIGQLRRDIEATQQQIEAQDVAIGRINDQLSQLKVSVDPALQRKDVMLGQLHELFNAALTAYQDSLLERVEEEASKLFTEVRSEPDYAHLRIRDGYGLTIVDDRGDEVIGHSAGYEHLIALSLIAALQRCSPVQGPIVMDSPFGRLDEEHTRQVVAALPQVADQVVLLAFEGEFDRDAAVDALGSSLAEEYVLDRVSSEHTRIRTRED